MASLATCGIDEDVVHAELMNLDPLAVERVVDPPEPIETMEFDTDREPPGPSEENDGRHTEPAPERPSAGNDVSGGDSSSDNDSVTPDEQAPTETTSGIPWDELARCESGYGDGPTWDIDTGNGFYGGLQFEKESWDWAGGQQYAEYPHHATREQQIAVAEQLLEIHPAGIGAWPSCADQLGLR